MIKKNKNFKKKTFIGLTFFYLVLFLMLEIILRVLLPKHFVNNDSINFNAITFKDYVPNNSFFTFPSKYDNFKPTLNKINSIGLRGPEILPKKKYRILNIGDSYIQADEVGFNQTFTSKLNQKNIGIEFISHGIPSWSPTLEFAWILRNYEKLSIDEINLFLCVNDFFSMNNYNGSDEYYRSIATYNEDNVPVFFKIKTQKKTYESIKNLFNNFYVVKCILIFKNVLVPQVFRKNLSDKEKSLEDLDLIKLGKNHLNWGFDLKQNVDKTLKVLVDLNKFLRKNDIKLNILFVPNYWYFYDEARVSKNRSIHPDLRLFPKLGIESYSRSFIEKQGINFIGLTDDFLEFKKTHDKKLYYDSDAHWNENGHDIVFDVLYDYYKDKK